jgi:hypothetical protein
MVKQRAQEIAQAMMLGRLSVVVVTLAWQEEQTTLADFGPKFGGGR